MRRSFHLIFRNNREHGVPMIFFSGNARQLILVRIHLGSRHSDIGVESELVSSGRIKCQGNKYL